MPKYNDLFELNVDEIDLIENALRHEISSLANASPRREPGAPAPAPGSQESRIQQLHRLLGKLHNRKIWYGQVNPTGVPLG